MCMTDAQHHLPEERFSRPVRAHSWWLSLYPGPDRPGLGSRTLSGRRSEVLRRGLTPFQGAGARNRVGISHPFREPKRSTWLGSRAPLGRRNRSR